MLSERYEQIELSRTLRKQEKPGKAPRRWLWLLKGVLDTYAAMEETAQLEESHKRPGGWE